MSQSYLEKARLCYVDGCWAYFTTKPLREQWGDDWNDAPYEHNAGEPYAGDTWTVIKVAFDCGRSTSTQPCESFYNSPYSVKDINSGAVPWLVINAAHRNKPIRVMAGTTLKQFRKVVTANDGHVYESN